MAGQDKKAPRAGERKPKVGRLKLKKEAVRDLTAGESAKKVRGGGRNTCTCL